MGEEVKINLGNGEGKATRKVIYDHLWLKITNRRILNIECRS
jgi:hypothetical protein